MDRRPLVRAAPVHRGTDAVTDLADGFLGGAIGGLFLGGWALANYSTRRLPPRLERLRETRA